MMMILGDGAGECLKQKQTRWRTSLIHFLRLASPRGSGHGAYFPEKKKKAQRDPNFTTVVCH